MIRVKAERIHSTGRQADTGSFQRTSFECEASLGHKESLKKRLGSTSLERGPKGGDGQEPRTKTTRKGIHNPYLQGILRITADAVRG